MFYYSTIPSNFEKIFKVQKTQQTIHFIRILTLLKKL